LKQILHFVQNDNNLKNPTKQKKLRKELLTINFEKNEKVIAIEGKEIIKKKLGGKSPNLADAFVYWNWIRKGYRANRTINLMFASG